MTRELECELIIGYKMFVKAEEHIVNECINSNLQLLILEEDPGRGVFGPRPNGAIWGAPTLKYASFIELTHCDPEWS